LAKNAVCERRLAVYAGTLNRRKVDSAGSQINRLLTLRNLFRDEKLTELSCPAPNGGSTNDLYRNHRLR
jgi:hypothetical protein